MLFRRHSLKSLNKSPQMSLGTKQPDLINTAALLTLRYLARGQSYVPGSAERGGRGANSCSSSQGSRVSPYPQAAQRISSPFPCKLLFWESSASLVLITLRWKPINIMCIMCCFFFEEILLLIALGSLPSGFLSAAMKPLPFVGWGQAHKCRQLTIM